MDNLLSYEECLSLREKGIDKFAVGYYNDFGRFILEPGIRNNDLNKMGMHGKYAAAYTADQFGDLGSQIVANIAECNHCGEILQSYHRHDFMSCMHHQNSFIDGGTDYIRSSGVKTLTVYENEPHEIVRMFATRGTFDDNGNRVYKPVKDLTDDHLEAILDYGGADWHLNIIRNEIKFRKTK